LKGQEKNCIFCGIVNSKVSARVITQNDNAIALLDAFPLSVGHTLIIPKKHYSKIQDMDKIHSSSIFDLLGNVTAAVEEAAGTNASTIAIHNGVDAGQEILHVHIHIIPRTMDDGAGPVHSMFKNRPNIGHVEMDSILHKIKLIIG
jgi:histidine triad (HIT) family protein